MPGPVIALVMLATMWTGSSQAQGIPDFVAKERVGDLRIGSSESEVKAGAGCPVKIGEAWRSATLRPAGDRRLFGPSTYHEDWENAPCGIKVSMAGAAGRVMRAEAIAVFAPSTLGTARGIRIGSTEQEVMQAYKAEWNRQVDEAGKAFVAGSVDRGLIFYFENGRVIRILLRAKAD